MQEPSLTEKGDQCVKVGKMLKMGVEDNQRQSTAVDFEITCVREGQAMHIC